MDLSIIAQLVKTRVRLILPEFGAFLVQRLEDGFSVDNVTFSAFLRYDDGSFVNALVEDLGISRPAAQQQAAMIIQELNQTLEANSVCVLPQLGVLRRVQDGLVVLEPDASATASMAVDAGRTFSATATAEDVSVEPVPTGTPAAASTQPTAASSAMVEASTIAATPPPATTATAQQPAAVPPVAPRTPSATPTQAARPTRPVRPAPPRYVQRKPVKRPKVKPPKDKSSMAAGSQKHKGAGGVVVLVVLLLMVAFVGVDAMWLGLVTPRFLEGAPYLAKESTRGEQSSSSTGLASATLGSADGDTQDVVDSDVTSTASTELQEEYQQRVDAANQPAAAPTVSRATTVPAAPAPTASAVAPVRPSAPGGAYKIIAGSFSVPQNASGFAASVQQRGYEGQVVENGQGMHMVTLGSYPSQATAQQALNTLRDEFPDAWIYR